MCRCLSSARSLPTNNMPVPNAITGLPTGVSFVAVLLDAVVGAAFRPISLHFGNWPSGKMVDFQVSKNKKVITFLENTETSKNAIKTVPVLAGVGVGFLVFWAILGKWR